MENGTYNQEERLERLESYQCQVVKLYKTECTKKPIKLFTLRKAELIKYQLAISATCRDQGKQYKIMFNNLPSLKLNQSLSRSVDLYSFIT